MKQGIYKRELHDHAGSSNQSAVNIQFTHDYITRDGWTPEPTKTKALLSRNWCFQTLANAQSEIFTRRPFEEGVIAWYTFLKQFQVAPQTDQIEGEENVKSPINSKCVYVVCMIWDPICVGQNRYQYLSKHF